MNETHYRVTAIHAVTRRIVGGKFITEARAIRVLHPLRYHKLATLFRVIDTLRKPTNPIRGPVGYIINLTTNPLDMVRWESLSSEATDSHGS